MASQFALDSRASKGFENASGYDTYRPSYLPEVVEKLLSYLGVANQNNARIIDLACGTGKFTELLAARHEKFSIVGIEPHEGMRQELVKKNLGSNVQVLDGNAGEMPIEDGWADSLIAAQAFHWFATEASLKEIHRVLKPTASFGMVWNIEDYNAPKEWPATTKWEQVLNDILFSIEDGHPRFRHMKWKEAFQKQDSVSLNGAESIGTKFLLPLHEDNVRWTVWLTDDAIWSRYTTLSQIANLNDDKREEIRRKVVLALQGDEVERNAKGEIAVHGVTYIACTSRI